MNAYWYYVTNKCSNVQRVVDCCKRPNFSSSSRNKQKNTIIACSDAPVIGPLPGGYVVFLLKQQARDFKVIKRIQSDEYNSLEFNSLK